eukprot:g13239.t1
MGTGLLAIGRVSITGSDCWRLVASIRSQIFICVAIAGQSHRVRIRSLLVCYIHRRGGGVTCYSRPLFSGPGSGGARGREIGERGTIHWEKKTAMPTMAILARAHEHDDSHEHHDSHEHDDSHEYEYEYHHAHRNVHHDYNHKHNLHRDQHYDKYFDEHHVDDHAHVDHNDNGG